MSSDTALSALSPDASPGDGDNVAINHVDQQQSNVGHEYDLRNYEYDAPAMEVVDNLHQYVDVAGNDDHDDIDMIEYDNNQNDESDGKIRAFQKNNDNNQNDESNGKICALEKNNDSDGDDEDEDDDDEKELDDPPFISYIV
jgi:hypothetical protein